MSVLEQSEGLGFTAGINFRSREVLLAGMRELLRGLQKNVPGQPKPAKKGLAGRR